MAQHLIDSAHYEFLFWEAALKQEMWPV